MKYTWKCYIPTAAVRVSGLTAGIINGAKSHRLGTALTSEIAAHPPSIANSNEVKSRYACP